MEKRKAKSHHASIDSTAGKRKLKKAKQSAAKKPDNDKVAKIAKKKAVVSTQSFLPIKDIRDGIIITKNHRYIKLLEVSSTNFLDKSPREQRKVVYAFMSLLKICPVTVQFKTISRKTDMDKFISNIVDEAERESNAACRTLQYRHIEMIKGLGLQEGVSRHFYLIFQFEDEVANRRAPFEDIRNMLEFTASRCAHLLEQCGNEVMTPDGDSAYTSEVLYNMLCRKLSEEKSFNEYALDILDKYCYITHADSNNPPVIPVTEYISPRVLDFSYGKFSIVDGKFYAYAYIPSNGYRNTTTCAGWLSPLINAGEGIDIDVFLHKEDKGQIIQRIGVFGNINKANLSDKNETSATYDTTLDALSSGLYIKRGLASGEDFYYFATFITFCADTLEELDWKIKSVEKLLVTQDMEMRLLKYRQKEAYMNSLPLCAPDNALFRKARRNALTSGAGSLYPFTAYEVCDENGLVLGVNKSNQSLVAINPFDSSKYMNANITILGCTGSGKTFTLMMMATRFRMKNIQTFIIAPDKGYEFKRLTKAIGGTYAMVCSGSPQCINIMEIRKANDENTKLLDGTDVIRSILIKKVEAVKTFMLLRDKDISNQEMQLIDECIIKTYAKFGITEDNDSLIDSLYPDRYKAMPTLRDLYDELRKVKRLERTADIMKVLVTGSAKSFCGQTNVDLNNKFVVCDLSELPDDLQPLGMFTFLDYAFDKAREDRTVNKMIFIDEAWKLLATNPQTAEYVLRIFKTIRGVGGGCCVATQDVSDFFALENGKYGKGIINACKTKVVLRLESNEAETVEDVLSLTDNETLAVEALDRGNALLIANTNNIFVDFRASLDEEELYTTDPAKQAELVAQMKARAAKVG